jgi:hypothetical protein
MMQSASEDARLCVVLSIALVIVACAVFAMTVGTTDAAQGWLVLLPAYFPVKYAVSATGFPNGPVIQMVSLILIVMLSFACYFGMSFGIACAFRHRHHH